MKLSRLTTILASFFLAGLTSCDNASLPHVFSGNEVPQATLDEQRPVESPNLDDVHKQPWKRLGEVPAKPTDFTSQPLIDETRQEMIGDRDRADHMKEAIDNPGPQPLAPGSVY